MALIGRRLFYFDRAVLVAVEEIGSAETKLERIRWARETVQLARQSRALAGLLVITGGIGRLGNVTRYGPVATDTCPHSYFSKVRRSESIVSCLLPSTPFGYVQLSSSCSIFVVSSSPMSSRHGRERNDHYTVTLSRTKFPVVAISLSVSTHQTICHIYL